MGNKLIKIAVVGPESTGKSTIASLLAQHYHTVWVPEYARYYCATLQKPCTLQDEENMFYGQLALEAALETLARNNVLICDTTFLTVKVWSDYQLGITPQVVLDTLKTHPYDFYLLMDTDLPWEADPLRDFENLGEYFMQVWHTELQALGANYTLINGKQNRLSNAIAAIDMFLKQL
ncbi:MAG: NadR [Sphingobacteriales bacterium]|nr:MAG: NadR [Sphingobacteriales bacterium]TAF81960.1 MAG: NadR [Sphingobacteriales bacterium]